MTTTFLPELNLVMAILRSRDLLLKPLLTTFDLLPVLSRLFHIPSIPEAALPGFINIRSSSDDHAKREIWRLTSSKSIGL
jgi:hypothetical protein